MTDERVNDEVSAVDEAGDEDKDEEGASESLFWHGVVGGMIAGLVFILAQMVLSLALDLSFFYPLRLISTLILGVQALEENYSLVTAALVGIVVHMLLSALYGVIFVYLLALVRQLHAPTGRLVFFGGLYGLLLWGINFLVIAPAIFPQFTRINGFWLGLVAHTFFYGILLGVYVAEARPGLVAVET